MSGQLFMDPTREVAKILNDARRAGGGERSSNESVRLSHARTTFRFGIGLIALAPFCATIGLLPWPGIHPNDEFFWFACASILVAVGAWEIDRAKKIERDLQKNSPSAPSGSRHRQSGECEEPASTIRRVK